VPQKAVTFRGTVASNIRFGDNGKAPATDDEVETAMRIAQGADFVEQMEGRFDAEIAQAGSNLSGGQKQRLAIARAVARKPEIYIFDDSFSALDYKTDRALRTALKRETAGVTSLIVAQRSEPYWTRIRSLCSTKANRRARHTQAAAATCEVYKEIAMSQLSEEELYA
jgi:ATP-binding cassette subfamily B protein